MRSSVETNWAGNVTFTCSVLRPRTVDDVMRAVRRHDDIGAVGSRHSFSSIANRSGALIDFRDMPKKIELVGSTLVRVAAGVTFGELAVWLERRGLALQNLGSLPGISVVGAYSTGTHGSGSRNPVLADSVVEIDFVDGVGDLRTVRASDPEFAALAVGAGAFGIILSVTIRTEPTYRVTQRHESAPSWNATAGEVDHLFDSGYSVSIFTRWEDPLIGDALVKRRDDVDQAPWSGLTATEAGPDRFHLGGIVLDNLTPQDGTSGPWFTRLPHFTIGARPSFGSELQSEYLVPRPLGLEALLALRARRADFLSCLLLSELRTVAADDALLSPAQMRDSLAIHFTWVNDVARVARAVDAVENILRPFAPRPHWGKLHAFSREQVLASFPRAAEARSVFDELDPRGAFASSALVDLGLRSPPER
ncbi:MAG: FAD-binding protein [Microcella sp.]|uniref:FAD-binding protein n=1 Tax=Microcella sp. TaxID=1913979 RepID=UPI003314A72C